MSLSVLRIPTLIGTLNIIFICDKDSFHEFTHLEHCLIKDKQLENVSFRIV